MPVIKITKSIVDAIPLTTCGQVIYKDAQLKGFGVKVGTGAKTYIAEGSPNGHSRLVTIGRHGVITCEQARKKAQAILQDMREGLDPNKFKKAARAKKLTLREAAQMHEDSPRIQSPRTITLNRAMLRLYFSDWLDKPLGEITRIDCYERHRRTGKNHGIYAANCSLRLFSAIYNRALKLFEDLPMVNPTIAVDWYPEYPRDSAIPAEMLADWYAGIRKMPNQIRADYLLFVLLSGQRRESAATMRWEHVDLEAGTLFVPKPKGGERRAFELPLSDMMVDLLWARKEQNVITHGWTNPWVWPAASESGHIMDPALRGDEVQLFPRYFRTHDLRHTYVTSANAAGVSPYDIKLLVNHKMPGGDITAQYISAGEYLRRSQQKVTDYMRDWMGLPPPQRKAPAEAESDGNVVWTTADIWATAEEERAKRRSGQTR